MKTIMMIIACVTAFATGVIGEWIWERGEVAEKSAARLRAISLSDFNEGFTAGYNKGWINGRDMEHRTFTHNK